MRMRRIAMAAAAAGTLALAGGGTAGATGATATFGAQVQAAGLTTAQVTLLQAETDRYLAMFGGRQVSLNEIDVDGRATIRVALPGESTPRSLAGADIAADVNCDGGADYGHFCAYSGPNFTGTQIDMYNCGKYSIPSSWGVGGSWDNNQSTGTIARMYNNAGTSIIFYTDPAHSYDTYGDWTPVGAVRNC